MVACSDSETRVTHLYYYPRTAHLRHSAAKKVVRNCPTPHAMNELFSRNFTPANAFGHDARKSGDSALAITASVAMIAPGYCSCVHVR